MKTHLFISLLILGFVSAASASGKDSVDILMNRGEFTKTGELIDRLLKTETDQAKISELTFKKDLMRRIRLDFRRTREEVITYIKKYYDNVTDAMMDEWERSGHLEMRMIDGEKKYFGNAAPNLFRVNAGAKKKKIEKEGNLPDTLDTFLEKEIPQIIQAAARAGGRFTAPKTIELHYTLSVKADVVPEGEIIRCWMPFPRATVRQSDIQLLSASQNDYIIAPEEQLHRSIYMEKKAEAGKKTEFSFKVSYKAKSEYTNLLTAVNPQPFDAKSLAEHISERPPHIVFTDKIKALSDQLVKPGMTDIEKLTSFYTWISSNIPWASALEYSTIPNISDYCITNGKGDCGIKTLLFMTLARYNNIPAKWQSGWMLHPGSLNLHDWAEVYIGGLGWVPVDQSFGIQDLLKDDAKYFFLGSTDYYHLTVNDDYSRGFFPAKKHHRSETVDFQRGEVEWQGGNLYFDSWNYSMKVNFPNDK
ncbi:MAG: transglutaminase-like domain-containing protein [Ignavibacteriaceae bacterium]|nr:transglutaminase-like domain-containing protein [Ignavibacteriaceae bacterium]